MIINSNKEIIGELKKYMFINGISSTELAERLNTTNQNVNNMFRRSNPSLVTFLAVVDALGATVEIEIKKKNQ